MNLFCAQIDTYLEGIKAGSNIIVSFLTESHQCGYRGDHMLLMSNLYECIKGYSKLSNQATYILVVVVKQVLRLV